MFDYALREEVKPDFLKDKINYQVMGTNDWKHVSDLKATHNDTLTFYLDTQQGGALNLKKPSKKSFSKLEIDFADRTNTNSYYYAFKIVWDSLNNGGGIMYKSESPANDIEFSRSFSGKMRVSVNKKDMDYSAVLFEQIPGGRYFYFTYYMGGASYSKDNAQRQLLTQGKKTTLPFTNSYFTSKKLNKGSKLVLIIDVNKSSSEQIN